MSLKRKIEELTESLNTNKAKKELLESVVRVYKKDGTEFNTLGKNFSSTKEDVNVKVIHNEYSLRASAKKLFIDGYSNGNYVSEEVDITPCVDYIDFEVSPERIINESFVKPYVILTPDEIMHEIELKINLIDKWIKNEEDTLNNLQEYIDIFLPRVKDILSDVKKLCGDNTTLWYDMRDLLKEEF